MTEFFFLLIIMEGKIMRNVNHYKNIYSLEYDIKCVRLSPMGKYEEDWCRRAEKRIAVLQAREEEEKRKNEEKARKALEKIPEQYRDGNKEKWIFATIYSGGRLIARFEGLASIQIPMAEKIAKEIPFSLLTIK
jgi:hypothetical protein